MTTAMRPQFMNCFLVEKTADGRIMPGMSQQPLSALSDGDVLVRVQYSSVNYKDALATEGHRGIVSKFPHVPGIDAAGVVAESSVEGIEAGSSVIVTGYELGVGRWGGWAEFIRVPADWVVPLPKGLSLREAMILGTAGFTAAQCVLALERQRIIPGSGPVVVTGATGGVGCVAVMLLAKLGYHVAAVSGKPERADWLRSLGAVDVLSRDAVNDSSDRPLLSTRWAGAIDSVGGNTLSTLVRSTQHRGCVAACGLVGGDQLPLTVYPFLLRGVRLEGVDSAMCPYSERIEIWRRLSQEWKLDRLQDIATEIPLDRVTEAVQAIRDGQVVGRTLVAVS